MGLTGSAMVPLNVGDYLELYVAQSTGFNLSLGEPQNSRTVEMSVILVCPAVMPVMSREAVEPSSTDDGVGGTQERSGGE